MKRGLLLSLWLCLSLPQVSFAFDGVDCCRAWVINGALGLSFYTGPIEKDHQAAIGRLSVGHLLTTQSFWQALVEVGLQSGNSLSLRFSQEDIDSLGGVEIETTLKPTLDILLAVEAEIFPDYPVFSWFKGGVAYREMKTDKRILNHPREFSPEVMAGLGLQISDNAVIHLGYQLLLGKPPRLTVDKDHETAFIRHIPTQQSVLLGFSYLL